jgi:methylglutaconyl-CoA hydratase
MSELVELRREEDLLWVTMNDPRRANALSPALASTLTEVFERPWRAEGVRALLLAGAGKNFSAGADLEHLAALKDASEAENRADSDRLRRLFESLLRQEALTIALVHGACVAGGCGLATACDFVVAAEDARLLYSEVRIGFVAALVATYLPLRCRGSDIRELLLDPEFVDARRALGIGLVNRVVPSAELAEAARRLAVEILTRASSEAIARTKRILLQGFGMPLPERLEAAAAANAEARATDDCKRGIAAFLETKQAPKWR